MPEVSVIIPSFNHAKFIGEAVQSVLTQTLHDLELIVVDDGSTDNSLEILDRFSDPRMRIIRQENRGAHAAINRGLEASASPTLTILNSDDIYHFERLEKVLGKLKEEPTIGFAGSFIEVIDHQGKPLGIKHGFKDLSPWSLEYPERSFRAGEDLRAALLTENYWSTTSNFVFSREVYEQVGDFRPLRYTHDWDFALRSARLAPQMLIPEPLIQYRVHPTNTIREDQSAMIFEICWILAVHMPEHLTDQTFFDREPLEARVDQLLHSIYTFGVDRVLNVLLLMQLDKNPKRALQILEPGNPIRNNLIAFIGQVLEKTAATQDPGSWARIRSRLLRRRR